MYTCDHCRELIWDDLFGLLEAGASAGLRHHVAGCQNCQAEMATAMAHHRLVAEAARLDLEIPPFQVPVDENGQTLFQRPYPEIGRAKRHVRIFPWWATAAAILLLVGLPFGLYEFGRLRKETVFLAAEERVAQIVKEREALKSQAQTDQENLVQGALAKHLRLQVVGPAAYQPGAVTPYRIRVTDVAGHPADVPVTARLLDAGDPVVLETKQIGGKGELLVSLPPNLALAPASTPRLQLVAQGQEDLAPVPAFLRVLEPAYRTHLAIDKPVYHAGDSIYFRSLTLERFGLKAPGREFPALYTLADASGKVFQTLRGPTRKDGIGAGEFVFSPNWPAGEYTLTVRDADEHFPSATRRLWYQPAPPGPRPAVPVTPEKLHVDFFPEGGELIADVDNRVYFRVHTPRGRSADLQGALVDSHGREVVAVSTAPPAGRSASCRGLGVFALRPQAGEIYQLRVPQGVDIDAAQLPSAQKSGVALSLPAAVSGPEEPLRVLLQQTGPGRNLVVALFCHGRLVAQELVPAKSEIREVHLGLAVPCAGVVRVTVFEERQGQLWPVAERLAYRKPKELLVLSAKTDKDSYTPGEKVKLDIRTVNEKGEPEPALVLAAVVNQAASARTITGAEASLPAYFHLTSELEHPEDLEQADILLNDSPEAAAALDLYLGTQGWRRFAAQEIDTTLVRGNAGRRAQDLAELAIIKLDNLDQVEGKYALFLNDASALLHDALQKRDQELVGEGKERLEAARSAAQELAAYDGQARGLLSLGVGVGGVALLGGACVLLAIALVRLARGLAGNRPYLAGAFTALLLCALLAWVPASSLGHGHPMDRSVLTRYAQKLDGQFDVAAIAFQHNQEKAASRALSVGRGLLAQGISEKRTAPLRYNEEAPQGQQPGPGLPGRRPWVGFLGSGQGTKPPVPEPPQNNAPGRPLPVRAYAYVPPKEPTLNQQIPETILWEPALPAENGTAEIGFTLPLNTATYRIHLQGHSAAGRLGVVEEKLQCREKSAEAAR